MSWDTSHPQRGAGPCPGEQIPCWDSSLQGRGVSPQRHCSHRYQGVPGHQGPDTTVSPATPRMGNATPVSGNHFMLQGEKTSSFASHPGALPAPDAGASRAGVGQPGAKVRGTVAGPLCCHHAGSARGWQPAVPAHPGCQIDSLLNSTLLPSPAIIIKCMREARPRGVGASHVHHACKRNLGRAAPPCCFPCLQ